MMVTALGIARLTAGQNNAVLPVYTGSNAVAEFDTLALAGVRRRADARPVLHRGDRHLRRGAALHAVRPLRLCDRRQRGGGAAVRHRRRASVKIVTYAVSGLLAGIAAVLYVAQYRQGKPDAGAGLELDAIAAVVIGGTSLMGGRGAMAGTFCGVLIFGLLSNILQLHNINSNLQLVLKGLIIIGTVLVQERNAADLFSFLRLPLRRPARTQTAAARADVGRDTVSQTRRKRKMKRRHIHEARSTRRNPRSIDRAPARIAGRSRRTRNGRSASRRRPRSSRGARSSTRTSSPRPRSIPTSS